MDVHDSTHEPTDGGGEEHLDAFSDSGFDPARWADEAWADENGAADDPAAHPLDFDPATTFGDGDDDAAWEPPTAADAPAKSVAPAADGGTEDAAPAAAAPPPASAAPPAAAPAADAVAETLPPFEVPRSDAQPVRTPGGRITPHDLNAEKSVLGALLITPDRIVEVSEIARPDDFFDRRNRLLMEVMLRLDARGQVVDQLTLLSNLRAVNALGEIGGVSYLAEVAAMVATSAHVKHHAGLVAELAKLRGLIDASNHIIARAFETPPDSEEVQTLIDESEASIFQIASKGEARGAASVSSVLDDVFHDIEAQRTRGEFTGIPSGFY
ncbi:MAG: DnaB-like helicase N-terminal domain-containing protein, partial [Planctomycetota bacterium]